MESPPSTSESPLELDALWQEHGELDPRVYDDPSIHALEQEHVFGRSWLLLTHESCLSEPGRYVTTTMAEDPVVVTRDADGSIHAFLNQCRHRGVPICRHEAGRARSFTCSYHGWTYDGRGRLLTVPEEAQLFRCPLDRDTWSAIPVPRIETRHGLVFGSWDPQIPSLEEWLGDARWYFDLAFDRPGGTEAVPGVSRRRLAANWKFGAEQFTSDDYHFSFTHVSGNTAMQSQRPEGVEVPNALKLPISLMHTEQGHGMGFLSSIDHTPVVFGDPRIHQWVTGPRLEYLISKYGKRAREVFPIHMNFFPNTAGLWPCELRVWQPRGPGQMEVWSWALIDRAAPTEVKDALRVDFQRTFGASGVFEIDDSHHWREAQRLLGGWQTRRHRFNVQLDGRAESPPEPELTAAPSERGARHFHRRWTQMIQAKQAQGGAR